MSCEQREHGTFGFKQTGYTQIMRSVREMFQALDNYRYEVAVCMYEALKEKKVKKDHKATFKFIDENTSNNMYRCYHKEYMSMFKVYQVENKYGFEIDSDCIEMALKEIYRNDNNTRLKPRRSAYPKLTNKDKSFEKEFGDDLITICFMEKSLQFTWTVRDGNRTVDRADDHYMTGIFFKIVSNYKWKIGEGGETVCVSESFDDDPCTPDSCASTTRLYENLSKKQLASRKKMQKALLKSGYYG
jgi:hypothetical protein